MLLHKMVLTVIALSSAFFVGGCASTDIRSSSEAMAAPFRLDSVVISAGVSEAMGNDFADALEYKLVQTLNERKLKVVVKRLPVSVRSTTGSVYLESLAHEGKTHLLAMEVNGGLESNASDRLIVARIGILLLDTRTGTSVWGAQVNLRPGHPQETAADVSAAIVSLLQKDQFLSQ